MGDITYTCSGSVACMVEIVVNADDTVTVTSTGGMVMVAQSMAAMDRYQDHKNLAAKDEALGVAMAINDPLDAADGILTGVAAVTRTDEGTTITLSTTEAGLEPAYKKMGIVTPEITGWYGETQMRAPKDALIEHATVYSNIEAPTNELYSGLLSRW